MSTKQEQFIESIAPKAQEIQQKYGVPASIAIAQAALESGWGASAKGNNLYGIKAGRSWQGATIDMATHEYINGARTGISDRFRAYASAEHSMENYGQFLAKNGRYSGVIQASDAHDAADALQRAGYATDPKYASKLKSIINNFNLTRFDDASYRGYADNDDSFEKNRRRLNEQRESDPKTWDDFKQSFIQLLATVFFSAIAQVVDTPKQDQTTVQRPEIPSAVTPSTRTTERA